MKKWPFWSHSCFSTLTRVCISANKCSSEEGLVHMQKPFSYRWLKWSENDSQHKTSTSMNSECFFPSQKIILMGHQRELDQDKWVCGEINWFPSLVCRTGELHEEEDAGTEMEDWKVGEEINWSHYVPLCYLGLEKLQRVRPRSPDEARIWAVWNGSNS